MRFDEEYALIADIGGTNARFARIHLPTLKIDCISQYVCAEFTSLKEAVACYLQSWQLLQKINQGTIAIACPVMDDTVSMTNLHWRFSIKSLQKSLGFKFLALINDFVAQAYSLQVLSRDKIIPLGCLALQTGNIKHPRLVIGAGTGLGAACLLPVAEGYCANESEAGHMEWATHTTEDCYIYDYLKRQNNRVSVERILSGKGLETIYVALAEFYNESYSPLCAAEITQRAIEQDDVSAKRAVRHFIDSMARFAGDMALAFSAHGGVYLGGGILPKLLPLINEVDFRYHFEDKGRFKHFNKQIPTAVLTEEHPGLLGAGAYCHQFIRQEVACT